MRRWIAIACLILLTLALPTFRSAAQISVTMPTPTGPYAVGRTVFNWIDSARHETYSTDPAARRELIATVYYPAQPAKDAKPAVYADNKLAVAIGSEAHLPPMIFAFFRSHAYLDAPLAESPAGFPILIFSPGYGTPTLFYTTMLEMLASHGYVIAALVHPYSTSGAVFIDGRVIKPISDLTPGTMNDLGAVWPGDIRFALTQMEQLNQADSRFKGRLDTARVGAFGHSFGGASSAEANRLDSRFKAGINMDGSFIPRTIGQPIHQPFMLMSSDRDDLTDSELKEMGTTREQLNTTFSDFFNGNQRFLNAAQTAYRFTLKHSRHNTFTSDFTIAASAYASLLPPSVVGTIPGARAVQIIDAYVLAFFDKTLWGLPSPLLDGASPAYPEVELQILGQL